MEDEKIQCLQIIGQIEGHLMLPPQNKTTKYEHVLPQLVAMKLNDNVEGVLVLLNTVGGDVEAGLAIAEMLSSLNKPVVSLVLGGGHSIGVPLAVAADYSYICKSATMTIHPVRMNGTIIGVQQAYEYFDKMQERISSFVTSHSKISSERFKSLLLDTGNMAKDVGTILDGEMAVREGIIDEVGGLNDALKKLESLIKEKEKNKKSSKQKASSKTNKGKSNTLKKAGKKDNEK